MYEQLEVLRMAKALAGHAAARQTTIAGNVANADTPGYRARDIESFASYLDRLDFGTAGWRRKPASAFGTAFGAGAGSGSTSFARQAGATGWQAALPAPRQSDAPAPGAPNGNAVSIESEMMRAVDARHRHDMALSIYRSATGILRTSLGR